MSAPARFQVQRLSATSRSTWRTVLSTESRGRADQCFLAHTTQLRPGASVRLLDNHHDVILAKFTHVVHTALKCSTC